MKTSYSIIIIIVAIIIGFVIGDFVGSRKPIPNLGNGEGCFNSVNQALTAKLNCPARDTVYQIGCTDKLEGAKVVEVLGATNVILSNKSYKVIDIISSAVKSTAVQISE
jgi:hypothetical protein